LFNEKEVVVWIEVLFAFADTREGEFFGEEEEEEEDVMCECV
jgi:hypothetical protein